MSLLRSFVALLLSSVLSIVILAPLFLKAQAPSPSSSACAAPEAFDGVPSHAQLVQLVQEKTQEHADLKGEFEFAKLDVEKLMQERQKDNENFGRLLADMAAERDRVSQGFFLLLLARKLTKARS
jgi:hypothetical protein